MGISILKSAGVLFLVLFGLSLTIFVLVPLAVRLSIGVSENSTHWRDAVLARYQRVGADRRFGIIFRTFAWMFAWFKLRLDPMFGELPGILAEMPSAERILDIGCGFGVAGCALLSMKPGVRIMGIDPAPGRVRVAAAAFGEYGKALVGAAPDFELPDGAPFEAVFILDVIHFISDADLDQTLRRFRGLPEVGGRMVIRSIIPPVAGGSWAWKFAAIRRKLTGEFVFHRSVERIERILSDAGFTTRKRFISGNNPELVWFICEVARSARAAQGRE